MIGEARGRRMGRRVVMRGGIHARRRQARIEGAEVLGRAAALALMVERGRGGLVERCDWRPSVLHRAGQAKQPILVRAADAHQAVILEGHELGVLGNANARRSMLHARMILEQALLQAKQTAHQIGSQLVHTELGRLAARSSRREVELPAKYGWKDIELLRIGARLWTQAQAVRHRRHRRR